jgi:hypothetical protein
MDTDTRERSVFELHFRSLLDAGRVLAFPCDAAGRVDLDLLGRAALNDYLYARASVGREFRRPAVNARPACRAGAEYA